MNAKNINNHNPFSVVNFLNNVSKYDLDRLKIPFEKAIKIKQDCFKDNQKAKKQLLEQDKEQERVRDVVAKAQKIQMVNQIRDSQFDLRRSTAIKHQEALKSFIEEQKSGVKQPKTLNQSRMDYSRVDSRLDKSGFTNSRSVSPDVVANDAGYSRKKHAPKVTIKQATFEVPEEEDFEPKILFKTKDEPYRSTSHMAGDSKEKVQSKTPMMGQSNCDLDGNFNQAVINAAASHQSSKTALEIPNKRRGSLAPP